MNFHASCECRLEVIDPRSEHVSYHIMSGKEHVGALWNNPLLGEWTIELILNNGITFGYTSKIWECLFEKLRDQTRC